MGRRRRILLWIGMPLLLATGCCGIHCLQGPVSGRVEVADGAAPDDLAIYLYTRSHAFHGSYTADTGYTVIAAGESFLFPWMFGGIVPTGSSLRVIHPLYQTHYARFDKSFRKKLDPIRLENWDALLQRAEAGEDLSPLSMADLNRHLFELRHHFLAAHRDDPSRLARYVPGLHRLYERGLENLAPMGRDRFGSTKSSLQNLRTFEEVTGYRRPAELRALLDAAEAGDVAALIEALDAGADPNAWDASGRAAIHVASAEGHSAVVVALLERGAEIERRHEGLGSTALLDAIGNYQVETALLLIERGADVTLDVHGILPLSAATRSGLDSRVFRALLDAGALERARQPHHAAKVLHAASRGGRAELLRLLLERGVPPDATQGPPHFTALMQAALGSQPDTARLLIEAGADVNAVTDDGRTPLFMAHHYEPPPRRRAELVELLEAAGARR